MAPIDHQLTAKKKTAAANMPTLQQPMHRGTRMNYHLTITTLSEATAGDPLSDKSKLITTHRHT
jgi:hypothetical protein